MSDLYDLFALSDEPSAAAKKEALLAQIRQRQGNTQQVADFNSAWGQGGLYTGDSVLGGAGKAQMQQAQDMRNGLQKEQGLLAEAGQYAAGAKGRALDRALRAQQLKREREEMNGGFNLTIIQGEDGGQYFVNPRNPRAPAIPVTDADGNPIKKPGKSNAREMPASMVQEIADNTAALKQLTALETEADKKVGGILAGPLSLVPGTEAAQYTDAAKLNAKVIGRGIEGGRMTDADAAQYKALMPGAWDSDERRAEKVRRLRESANIKRSELLRAAKAAGHDVSQFETPAEPVAAAAPEDSAALGWARANPGDPRAKKILMLHGEK